MDESAEWRMKYDTEFAKNKQMQDELLKAKASLSASTKRFSLLKKVTFWGQTLMLLVVTP
jgi:hypothetical protein